MIKISKERYAELLRCEYKLNTLECDGVDNWEGYGDGFDDEYFEIIDLGMEDIIKVLG